jgi:type I restriction enzyme M protein
MDLVSKLWNFCHTLRHEGVDYNDYIEELTYILFLKIADERKIKIPTGCDWKTLIHQDEIGLIEKYNETLLKLSEQKNIIGEMFRQPIAKIRSSSALKKLLDLIDEINWSSYNEDVLGSTFEGLLEKAADQSKKGAGQYFTPRPLIESIVNIMRPDLFESPTFTISDVACGTCGFIISSYEWWKSHNSFKSLTSTQEHKVRTESYFGQELVVRPRRLAQMNLYLHGLNPLNIKLGDTIYEPLSKERFSCILTNPPFGNKGANQVPDRPDFKIKTSNKQLNFVQHVFSCLEDKGRAAIVLPDNTLFEDKASEMWKILTQHCNIHTILRLPRGTFTPYAHGVKANVVFFQKGIKTSNIWIYDARSNVEGVTKKDRPLTAKYFKEFELCYGLDPNGKAKRKDQGVSGRFRKFDIKEIKERKYKLDITWIKDKLGENDYSNLSAEILIRDTIIQVQTMLNNLKDVLTSLENE